ncbi:hypothetical protein OIU79_006260 [Salix purpurea]|uniref:O-fucosyltransferase family protein n=1 Tax=Salix purpurea TaxID=77065 RepID=A0A9Q0TV54_SALPP|nr:hypothetical protein OIU79_006260 [Salix purpurea]
MLLDPGELQQFQNHSSQMAALDFMVSIASDTFIPTYDGNMAKVVEGHRSFYLESQNIISPCSITRPRSSSLLSRLYSNSSNSDSLCFKTLSIRGSTLFPPVLIPTAISSLGSSSSPFSFSFYSPLLYPVTSSLSPLIEHETIDIRVWKAGITATEQGIAPVCPEK